MITLYQRNQLNKLNDLFSEISDFKLKINESNGVCSLYSDQGKLMHSFIISKDYYNGYAYALGVHDTLFVTKGDK